MCAICGCDGDRAMHDHEHDHPHHHAHPHDHDHAHGRSHQHTHAHVVDIEARILAKNDALAQQNRAWFAGREILALNLMSAPGAECIAAADA